MALFGSKNAVMSTPDQIRALEEENARLRERIRELEARPEAHEAAASLEIAAQRLELALDSAGAGMWDWAVGRKADAWSPGLFRLYGLDPATTTPGAEAWEGILHPEDREATTRALQRALDNHTEYDCSYRIVRPDGTIRWLAARGRGVYDSDGAPLRMTGLSIDITDQRKAEAALLHSRDMMRLVLEHMREAVAVHDREMRYLYVSQRYLKDYGITDPNIIGKHHYDVFPDLPQKWRDVHQRVLRGEVLRAEEDEYIHADGTRDWARWECRPWYEANGEIGGLIVYTEVITNRKLAEDALRESERWHRTVLQTAMDAYWRADAEGHVLEVNEAACRMYGYSEAELLGARFSDFEAVATPAEVQACLDRLKEYGQDRFETWHRRRDGTVFPVEVSIQLKADSPLQIVAFVRDITERRRTMDQLAQSQELMQVAQHAASFGVFKWDAKEGKTYWSDEIYALHNLEPGAVGPSPEGWMQLIHPDDRARVAQEMREAESSPNSGYDIEYRTLDGARWIATQGQIFRDAAGKADHVVGINIDITARKKSEQELARLVSAIEQAHETVLVTDASGAILYANPAFERMTGYTVAEALGKNPRILKSGRHSPAFYRALWAEISSGNVWRGKLENRRKDGTIYHESATISPVRDASGRIAHYIALKLDVSRESELQEQLAQSQKLESIGRLAGGVAHDFNNLLTVINGYSRMALAGLRTGDPLREQMEEICKAGERAAGLTRQLLAFSRKQILEPQALDLNAALSDMRGMLERLMGEDIHVHFQLNNEPAPVMADPNQLEQVIMNLAVNARDAMPAGGMLSFETHLIDRDEAYSRTHPEVRPGRYAVLAVSDTGTGMDEATRLRIFDPFFTTKPVGEGTGLGLSTVQGIVAQSGGHIELFSEIGQGTAFHICLPAVAEAAPEVEKPAPPANLRGHESILVVEDQEEVRNFVTAALRSHGYRVTQAANAREALDLARLYLNDIELVLTDVVMPSMGGAELVSRLEQIKPGLKSLFMSGYTGGVIDQRSQLAEGTNFLRKPFPPEVLLEQVRLALGTPAASGRILVVDDEPGVRAFLCKTLQRAGYEVTDAADGREALIQARAKPVDMVITDLVMPEVEGLETIQTLRREQPGVVIIAISGAFGGQCLKVARLMGAHSVLAKPLDADLLLERVAEALRERPSG